jgi:hypothetical protein
MHCISVYAIAILKLSDSEGFGVSLHRDLSCELLISHSRGPMKDVCVYLSGP